MTELLKKLADKLGINTSYVFSSAGVQKESFASDELLRFFIENMGYKAKTENDILKSLERLEKKRWQRALEAIYVCMSGDVSFDLVVKKDEANADIKVEYALEGSKKFKPLKVRSEQISSRAEGKSVYEMLRVTVLDKLEPEYYNLKVKTAKNEYQTVLAVAPKTCYGLDKKGKEKLFGFALQLYAVRSYRNWGIGDFTDLENIVDLLADQGGDIIGLNPLNVLPHDFPETASPYASVSRLFLNPIYIDVEKVPFYEEGDKDGTAIWYAKEKDIINYTSIYNAKIKALRNIFARVMKNPQSDYAKEFEAFRKNDSGDLRRLAIYETIAEVKNKEKPTDSNHWESSLQSSMGTGIKKFAQEHQDEIAFFEFLQFEADRQLKLVEKKVHERGMAVGLYRDMPVGVSQSSAEVWNDRSLYLQESGAGAPPDNSFPTGQKWGLGAFNPVELKERCYKPFIRILRANMRYAGAVRIDHIMGLSRLFVIPNKMNEGTYIRYNEKDMLNILALESYLNKCVVVGECIGNVEGDFRDRLTARDIYSLSVLWCERTDDNGTMRAPNDYDRRFVSSVGTHDMPPLKAWWYAVELTTLKNLKLLTEQEVSNAYLWRDHERKLLLEALDREGVWPVDKPRYNDYIYGDGYPEGLEEAVHAYMSKTNSEIFIIQPEDIMLSDKLQNLPGTDEEQYPNWRTKLPWHIEDLPNSEAFHRNMNAVKRWR